MITFRFCIVALLLACTATAQAATLVHNVTGYTLDGGELRRFAALEFEDGRVTRLYSSEGEALASAAGERVDGAGATLLPGLIDAHGHISGYGMALSRVDLVGSTSEAEAVARVDAAMVDGEEGWVLGRGWNQVLWEGRAFPARQSLDAVSGERPVALGRIDGHALWVNSQALEAAGIGDHTADPEGGQIIRDSEGRATGVLVDNAMDLVYSVLPAPTVRGLARFQAEALHDVARLGLTSVHDAGIKAAEVQALHSLAAAGELPVRVYAMLDVLDPGNDRLLEQGPEETADHMLAVRSVKISADGALGSRGAALFADYSDQPGHRGLLLLSDEALTHHMGRAMAAGFQVNTHAIGDLANTRVLDLYQKLVEQYDSRALRHRVEHSQILRPADIPRFARDGVIASIQPTHATSDKNMAGDRLGEQRLDGAYAWKSLLDSGARLAGGSDFPVESPNPFFGLYSAVTRQGHDGEPPGGWLPEQKLSRIEALALFTEGAAYAAHQEKVLGSLLPGYYADFILVRDDYFAVPEEAIWRNQVLGTWVAGRQVFPARR